MNILNLLLGMVVVYAALKVLWYHTEQSWAAKESLDREKHLCCAMALTFPIGATVASVIVELVSMTS